MVCDVLFLGLLDKNDWATSTQGQFSIPLYDEEMGCVSI